MANHLVSYKVCVKLAHGVIIVKTLNLETLMHTVEFTCALGLETCYGPLSTTHVTY